MFKLEIIEGEKKEIGGYDLLLLLFCEAKRRNIKIRTQDLLKTIESLASKYPKFFDDWEFDQGSYVICKIFEECFRVYCYTGVIYNVLPVFSNGVISLNISIEVIEMNYKDLSPESRDEANKLIEEIFQGLGKLKQRKNEK